MPTRRVATHLPTLCSAGVYDEVQKTIAVLLGESSGIWARAPDLEVLAMSQNIKAVALRFAGLNIFKS